MSNLAVDYSFTHPNPSMIHSHGYSGVLRYVTGSGKAITKIEAAELHRANLWISLVFESTAGRATHGRAAGVADRKAAEKAAKALGYPSGCVIFYAVDGDYHPTQVAEYFNGVLASYTYRVGIYGSNAIVSAYPRLYGWQTSAWSGSAVADHACLYQRQKPTVAHPLPGTDENLVLKPFPVWAPHPATVPSPTPAQPAPPAAGNPDHDLVVAQDKWRAAKHL